MQGGISGIKPYHKGQKKRPTVGLAGSFYRLCWGHEPVSIEDYNVEVDASAELVGPFLTQILCTLGLECMLMLEGYRLSEGNRMILVNGSCGDAGATVANETWTNASAHALSQANMVTNTCSSTKKDKLIELFINF